MVEDDARHVENYWYWYKEYHPGGIFGITQKCAILKPLYIPPCTRSTGF
jgi:hypothetical protein